MAAKRNQQSTDGIVRQIKNSVDILSRMSPEEREELVRNPDKMLELVKSRTESSGVPAKHTRAFIKSRRKERERSRASGRSPSKSDQRRILELQVQLLTKLGIREEIEELVSLTSKTDAR